jgi:formylglycine-generating enzyme required for sulfatase activity
MRPISRFPRAASSAACIVGRRLVSNCAVAALALAAILPSGPAHAQGCSGDINGDGRVDGVDLSVILSQWGTCPAVITSVMPSQGSTLGGTQITITGTGLASTSSVTIGGAPCPGFTVLSPTQVRATTPPGTAGQAAIAVTTPTGTSLAPTPFTYVVQTVTSISPSSGGYPGGTPITITGQYLAGTTALTIGGVPAADLVVVNSTTLTAVTPPGSVGAADVVVTGAKGTVTVPGGFNYLSVITPSWATLIEALPDPAVVTNADLRAAIVATGLAWRVRDNGTNIEMLLIPPGTFNMGCSASNAYGCASDGRESPVHSVTLTGAFYMGRYEVTQAQWQARMGSNPSLWVARPENGNTANTNRPVERVSWDQIAGAGGFLSATGLRLPTEAEWEYACRAGTTTAFHGFTGYLSGTNDDTMSGSVAWFSGNNGASGTPSHGTKAVGQKLANGFGLHDVSGNVWEWVNDWYSPSYYASSPSINPTGPATGSHRSIRGGSWVNGATDARSSFRGFGLPDDIFDSAGHVGFRVARDPL